MKTFRILLAAALALAIAAPALAAETLFEFERLRGVPNPPPTIRNIPGGGAPWMIDRGEARLEEDGAFKVEVEGLVLAAGPNIGTNPVPFFFATLSCLNADGTTNNIDTGLVPATSTGDARIEAVLTLPATCLAPVVFVRSGTNGRWFAVSGF